MKSIATTAFALASLLPAGAAFAQCAEINLSPASLPNGTQNAPYSAQLSQSGGSAPINWSAVNLPAGLFLGENGNIGGTPLVSGSFALRLSATDSAGCIGGYFLPLTIAGAPPPTPVPTITILRTTTAETSPDPLAGYMNITDPDAGASPFTAIISVDSGTIDVNVGTTAVTLSGDTTAEVTLSGTLADINTVLAGSSGASIAFAVDATTPKPFAQTVLTLEANDGALNGTVSGILSGPTVQGARVFIVPPGASRTLPASALNAQGGNDASATYGYLSSTPATVSVNSAGLASAVAARGAVNVDISSSGHRPAVTAVSINVITSVNVGTNLPSSIAANDGYSAFGSNQGLPSTSYYSDIFVITLSAGQAVTIKADSGDDLDTYMLIADANGFLLAGNDDDDTGALGVGSRIDFVAPAAGTYFIEQSTFNGLDTGNYTLTVEATPPRPGLATKPLRLERVKP